MNVYLAIILYIISVVAGILILFTGKNIPTKNFLIGALIHLLLIVLFCIKLTSTYQAIAGSSFFKLSFLFTICTGLVLAGISWKSNVHLSLKVYFSLFSLTLLLFLFSPSRLINFLLTASYSDTMGKTFSVSGNYFLEEQTSGMRNDNSIPHFKLIQKHGIFHETIQRDILFNGNPDSIKVVEFVEAKNAVIRGYTSKRTYVSTEIDSADVWVKLVKEKKDQIERKL